MSGTLNPVLNAFVPVLVGEDIQEVAKRLVYESIHPNFKDLLCNLQPAPRNLAESVD